MVRTLSIIMPVYQLGGTIGANLERTYRVCSKFAEKIELIPVDDGSRDTSRVEIERFAAENPEITRPVYLPSNIGKGGALRRGFEKSRGELILLLDGDLDLAPEMVGRFFEIMREKSADIVIGSKRHPESVIDYPWHRRLASVTYYGIVRLLIGLPLTDTQTGMKLFRRQALETSFERMLVKHFAFDLEILSIAAEAGFSIAEAPITMNFGKKLGCLSWRNVRQVMNDTLAIFYRLKILRYYRNIISVKLSEPPPKVSVVIACPAPSAYLTEALEGLAAQTLPPHEIIILPDEMPREKFAPPVRVIPTGAIRPAEKRNIGIAEATGEIVAFLDDDAAPEPQWLARACAYFSHPEIAAVGGPAVTPPRESLMAYLGGVVYASPLVSGNCRYRYVPERVRAADDLPSCNLLVRKSVLSALNGFNTRYWPGEDTILCMEIVHKLAKKMIYDPWAIVRHHRRALFLPHLRQIARYALHRGFFARRFPKTSRRISYMLPSLFVLGVFFGAIAAAIFPVLRFPYFCAVGFYLLVTFIFSAAIKPLHWLIVWLGIIFTHFVYGIRFLEGLIVYNMPSEVAKFDHPSENKK